MTRAEIIEADRHTRAAQATADLGSISSNGKRK